MKSEYAKIEKDRDRLLTTVKSLQHDRNYLASLEKHVSSQGAEAYEKRIAELQNELEECKLEAMDSRQEVAKVCAEIENYASILEAMEEKLIEAEERVKICEQQKEEAVAEVKAVRQRYINMISS